MIKFKIANYELLKGGVELSKWITLPIKSQELKETLESIGIDYNNTNGIEYVIIDHYETGKTELENEILKDNLDNLDKLTFDNFLIVMALIEVQYDDFDEAMESYDNYKLIPNINDCKALGRLILDRQYGNTDCDLYEYIDFTKLGEDFYQDNVLMNLTSYGLLEYI